MTDDAEKALKSIFKGGAIVFIGSLISKFVSLAFRILVGRTGVESYGVISVMMAVFSTALLFSNLGVPNGIQRYGSYYLGKDHKDSAIGTVHTGTAIVSISSILTAILLFVLAPFLSNEIFGNSDLILPIRMAAVAVPFRA